MIYSEKSKNPTITPVPFLQKVALNSNGVQYNESSPLQPKANPKQKQPLT